MDEQRWEAIDKLGIADVYDVELSGQATIDRANRSVDLLVHHGSRFIGKEGEQCHKWFTDALKRVQIRLLMQETRVESSMQKLRGLSRDNPNFHYGFYDGPAQWRIVVIDGGAEVLMSHYADEPSTREAGGRTRGTDSPQIRLKTGPKSLALVAVRHFEHLWHVGVRP